MTFTAEPAARVARGRRQSRLEAVERLLVAAEASGEHEGHPLPVLTGAGPEEIAEAFVAATLAAHAEKWSLDDPGSIQLCPRCRATAHMAIRMADAADPEAGHRRLVEVFDEAIALKEGDAKQASKP